MSNPIGRRLQSLDFKSARNQGRRQIIYKFALWFGRSNIFEIISKKIEIFKSATLYKDEIEKQGCHTLNLKLSKPKLEI